MIDRLFEERMRSGLGCAVVMAGSHTDAEHIEKVTESLKEYGIPFRVRICSIHKQPRRIINIMDEYNDVGGLVAYVTIAGGTDGLSGTLAYHALGPVISSPPDGRNESCLNNPPGSSNAYIEKPENVGRFIAQIFAGVNPEYREILRKEISSKVADLMEKDEEFHTKSVEDSTS